MIRLEQFISVTKYAKLCGVTNRAIYTRLRNRWISGLKVDNVYYVDIVNSPPIERVSRYDKKPIRLTLLPPHLNRKALMTVRNYASKLNVREGQIYERLILDDTAIIIDDTVFIDTSQYPIHSFAFSRKLKKERNQQIKIIPQEEFSSKPEV